MTGEPSSPARLASQTRPPGPAREAPSRDEVDPRREILNLEEAARFLGVSVKTFNKVLHSETLPARKIGREWKFSRQALVDWVGTGRSDRYYRESTLTRNGEIQPQRPPESDASDTAQTSSSTRRRTTGWRLELD
jgi:excisionase family DNA binding protein